MAKAKQKSITDLVADLPNVKEDPVLVAAVAKDAELEAAEKKIRAEMAPLDAELQAMGATKENTSAEHIEALRLAGLPVGHIEGRLPLMAKKTELDRKLGIVIRAREAYQPEIEKAKQIAISNTKAGAEVVYNEVTRQAIDGYFAFVQLLLDLQKFNESSKGRGVGSYPYPLPVEELLNSGTGRGTMSKGAKAIIRGFHLCGHMTEDDLSVVLHSFRDNGL